MKKQLRYILYCLLLLTVLLQCSEKPEEEVQIKTIEVSGNLSFGVVDIGSKLTKTFAIKNTGNAVVNISGIVCPVDFSADWAGGSIAAGSRKEVTVTFAPTEAKLYSGDISINSDAVSGTNKIQVSGSGKDRKAVLGVSPLNLNFEDVIVGELKTLTFTLSNTGDAPMTITSVLSSHPGSFSVEYDNTVAAGGAQQVKVTFKPSLIQTYSAQLTVTTNGGTATVSLSGNGVKAPAPKLSVTPASLSFGDVVVGESKTLTLTVSNTGNAEMVISGISPSQSVYTRSNFSSSVAAGGSQQVSVTFKPSAIQSYPAELTISTNGGNITVPLSGNGVKAPAPKLSVTPASLSFGDVVVGESKTLTLTVSNIGNAEMVISGISPSQSVYTRSNFSSSVAAGGSQQVSVTFKPSAIQSYPAELTISTNGGNITVPLSGNGIKAPAPELKVSPSSLSFGDVVVGESKTLTLIVSNIGNAEMVISGISPSQSVYTRSNFSSSVAAGGSQQVSVTFKPSAIQSYPAELTISTNGGNITVPLSGSGIKVPAPELKVTPASLSFGDVLVGESKALTLTISNTGNAEMVINSISPSESVFTRSSFSANVAAGGSQQVSVTFKPSAIQSYAAELTITTNGGTVIVPLSGKGTKAPAPELKVEPTSLSFGDVFIGNYSTRTFTISNTGNAALTISEIKMTEKAFYLRYQQNIAPGTSQQITVQFTPSEARTYSDQAIIITNGGNATVSFTGKGVEKPAPKLSVSTTVLDFGSVILNNRVSKKIILSNIGNEMLTITNISWSYWAYSRSDCSSTIAPGSSIEMTIYFEPNTAGNYNDMLAISSNGGNANVSLIGTGIAPTYRIGVSANKINFGYVKFGHKVGSTLRISNTGNAPLEIYNVLCSTTIGGNMFYCTVNGQLWYGNVTIPVGSHLDVTVWFAPVNIFSWETEFGVTGLMSIPSQAPGLPIYVDLEGYGINSTECNPVSNPSIGNFSECESYNGSDKPITTGLMTAAIAGINCSTKEITFSVKRCNGDDRGLKFLTNGTLYIYGDKERTQLYGSTNIYAGTASQEITIKELNMIGTKTYYAYIYQSDYGWSVAPPITVTY